MDDLIAFGVTLFAAAILLMAFQTFAIVCVLISALGLLILVPWIVGGFIEELREQRERRERPQ